MFASVTWRVCLCVSQCDQVMEFSWSALWNITDETPDNCQMFLNCRGMSLFLECLQVSPWSRCHVASGL